MTIRRCLAFILALVGVTLVGGVWGGPLCRAIVSPSGDGPPGKAAGFGDVATAATLPVEARKVADSAKRPNDLSLKGSYRTITDMAGRKVLVPKTISRALGTSPPATTFLYVLAPDKLGGWLSSIPKGTTKYIPKRYRDKLVFGWSQKQINYEAYIAARPDVVFVGGFIESDLSKVDLTQEKFGTIPVVVYTTTSATDYSEAIRFIGDVLGVPDRAEALIAYYQNVLNEVRTKVATIPKNRRVRVYYAEGNNGLSTEPSQSQHAALINVCGGVNVATCALRSGSGMTPVTIESVLMWKPDVIITTSREFATHAHADATWKKVPAVRNRRVHLTPSQPFNWFDRPPGANRIAGIPWTAHILYPDLFPENWFRTKVKEFYSLFYHYELSDEDLRTLLR
jgi:iron complex transport system substrate-binding protein